MKPVILCTSRRLVALATPSEQTARLPGRVRYENVIVIPRWGTTGWITELAEHGPTADTTLAVVGRAIEVPLSEVTAEIECSPKAIASFMAKARR